MGFVGHLLLFGAALPGVAGFKVRVGDLFSLSAIFSALRAFLGPGLGS